MRNDVVTDCAAYGRKFAGQGYPAQSLPEPFGFGRLCAAWREASAPVFLHLEITELCPNRVEGMEEECYNFKRYCKQPAAQEADIQTTGVREHETDFLCGG